LAAGEPAVSPTIGGMANTPSGALPPQAWLELLERQLAEVEMLACMYPEEGAFVEDPGAALSLLRHACRKQDLACVGEVGKHICRWHGTRHR